MNILVSNDDGINSKALRTLVKYLSEIGDVYVIAPDCERSANSHHFSLYGKMRIEEKQLEGAKKAYAFWGTPVDCIHAGVQFIFKEKMDIVVSGINKGWNLSGDAIYSGTVAAAREGFIQGLKAIAFSLDTFDDRDYTDAAIISRDITKRYMEEPKKNYFLNVNIPDLPLSEIKGIRTCGTPGRVSYNDNYSYEEEFGVKYIKASGSSKTFLFDTNDDDIDRNMLAKGYVTISPLYDEQINKQFVDEVKNIWNYNY